MASGADMALDDYVQRTQSWQGRGRGGRRGRGRGNFNENRSQTKPTGRGSLGARPKGSAFLRIGPKNNDPTDHNGIASSDLRDKIATKVKANMIDLREKLPPKPLPATKTKSFPKKTLQPPPPLPPPFPRNARAPPGNRVPAHYAPVRPTTAAAHGQPYILPQTRPIPRSPSPPKYRLPSEAEAKKITVTVPGLSKTTSEVYKREERLAAAILRQKESRQQSFMKSREHFIASSITSALGGEKERPAPHFYKYRSPSPPPPPPPPPPPQPVYHHHHQYPIDYPEPRGMGSAGRPKGVTTVTTMVISNLNDTVSKNDIFELCNAVGPVDSVTNTALGVAEVTFRFKDDALEAYRKYNQRNLDGQPMICHLQSGMSSSSRSRAPPTTSYRLPHADLYSGDAGYPHARPYYS